MQRINLYPSPLTPLVNDGTGDITHGDYDVAIDNLEAGTYVFAADIQNSGTQTGINVMLFDSDWSPLFNSTEIGHVKTTFTLKKPGRVLVRAFQAGETISNVIVERADTYALTSGGGLPGLLHQGYGAILSPSRRVTADETGESKQGCDRAYRQWVRGANGRIDLYRHGGRSAAFASMGQYYGDSADDRHVFRDPHGHVIRRHRDRERDYRGWRGHHARNVRMVVGRHIARQGCARDHTVHRMVQRRGLACHASFGRRLLRQGHGGILALTFSLGVAA